MSESPRKSVSSLLARLPLFLCLGAMIIVAAVGVSGRLGPKVEPKVNLDEISLTPRQDTDTSGFALVAQSLKPWSPNASLEEIGDSFRNIGTRSAESVDKRISLSNPPIQAVVPMGIIKASFLNYEGRSKDAYQTLVDARALAETRADVASQWMATLIHFQGVTAMRIGENENCIDCRGESSCILPIASSAVHINPRGSTLAIEHFTESLKRFPDDLEARWLLNVAHMTLNQYPDKVDPRYRVSLDHWLKSEFDIGRFRDVGHIVNLNHLTEAGGAIMDDFDNDGLLDLAVTAFDPLEPTVVYRNTGEGVFEDRSEEAGVTRQKGGLVCYQADYNNDGWVDILIVRGAWLQHPMRPTLLKNEGKGVFTDVTREAGLLHPVNSNSACWADYDNDGFVDLFIGCENQPNLLYRNKGDGSFQEVALFAHIQGFSAFCKGTTWIDYDNDDYPDLFLNNMDGTAQLHRNNRNGTFSETTSDMNIKGPKGGFSCWTWDYNNDGWLDIFATCYDRSVGDVVKGLEGKPHNREIGALHLNREGKRFEDVARQAGLDGVYASMGTNYADFDNDGFLDFYLGTGDPRLSTLIPNRMFKNVGGQRFSEITVSTGTGHLQKGHGVACGDWDRDGDVDIFIEMGGAVLGDKYHNILFQNPGQGNHSLTLKLVGVKTNRSAIGARIKAVTAGAQPQTIHRHVSTGSSFGANPLEQTIGLAKAENIATLEIHWPTSGTTQVFHDIKADQIVEITEFAKDYRSVSMKPIPLPEQP